MKARQRAGNIGGSVGVATPGLPGDSATFRENTDLLTSVTARVGYAWNNWLSTAKAAQRGPATNTARSTRWRRMTSKDWKLRFGWTAGAGVEWAVWEDWSIKLEYDYYGFGTRGVTFIDNVSATVGPLDIKQNIQVVKIGVNLHIFAGPGAPLGW